MVKIFGITSHNDILKCDKCKIPFSSYDQPKSLACGETICSACSVEIEKEAINKKFKCILCLEEHTIPDNGFPINKKIYALITTEPMEISRGDNSELLQENLNKVLSKCKIIWNDCENGTDIIREYCNEQIRKIQLSTEDKIEQINKLSDELIEFVKDYERKCVESYLKKKNPMKEELNKIMSETNIFINEKQAYLHKLKINDEEIKVFNKESEELETALNEKSVKLKQLIFDNKLIKFISNTNDINKFELGNFNYEQLMEPSELFSSSKDKTIKLWEIESGKCIKTFIGHNCAVSCIKNVLGDILISGDSSGLIKIWKIETGEFLKTIDDHTDVINKILLTSNDRFVTCSDDKTLKLFDLNTYECIETFNGHKKEVCSVAKISNESIVSCSKDKTLRIWNLNSGKCLKILRGHENFVFSLTVLSVQKIISGSYDEINIWEVDTGTCLKTFNVGHNHYISIIIQVSDDKIASCDESGKIIIWNVGNGQCLKQIDAHSQAIWCLVKLSCNKIISCSDDKKIKVWDVDTGDCLNTLKDHDDSVYCLDLLN